MTNKIIFATSNMGKMDEIKMIMADFPVEIISMKEAGVYAVIDETGKTFEENAKIKAETIMKLTGCITLADDSGLEIDYLNKEPGVYSARYLGENTSYRIKNNVLIDRLKGVEGDDRSARFVCAIAAAFPDDDTIVTRGTIEGQIGYEERGEYGFGYDPILYVPKYGMTTGEMKPEDKNKISHRGIALRMMRSKLAKRLGIMS